MLEHIVTMSMDLYKLIVRISNQFKRITFKKKCNTRIEDVEVCDAMVHDSSPFSYYCLLTLSVPQAVKHGSLINV